MPLKAIRPGVWEACHEIKRGPLRIPIRMTVLKDESDRLVLYSPTAIDEALKSEIAAFGEPTLIVAPNLYHHLYVRAAKEAFPQARVLCAPGLVDKRANFDWDGTLSDGMEVTKGLRAKAIAGAPKIEEFVLYHEASRTLVVGDLIFNLQNLKGLTSWFFRAYGAYGKPAQSNAWRFFVKDKQAAGRSVRELCDLNFENIVPCHGESILGNGVDVLENAVRATKPTHLLPAKS